MRGLYKVAQQDTAVVGRLDLYELNVRRAGTFVIVSGRNFIWHYGPYVSSDIL